MSAGETVWEAQADEGRYERQRVEAEEPWRLDEDERPTEAELAEES